MTLHGIRYLGHEGNICSTKFRLTLMILFTWILSVGVGADYSGTPIVEVNTNANRGPNGVLPDIACWFLEATVSLDRRKHSVSSAWLWSSHLGSSCYQHLASYSQERKYKEQKHYFSIPVSILNSVWGSLCILSLVNHWHSCKLLDQTPIVQHDYKHYTVTIRTYATLINLLLTAATLTLALVEYKYKTDCFQQRSSTHFNREHKEKSQSHSLMF